LHAKAPGRKGFFFAPWRLCAIYFIFDMMNVDILIIGQGICGTMLSWHLQKAGLSFLIIDEQKPNTASKAAAGIINPVTGRRIVKTWMIDELMPFVLNAYQSIEKEFNIKLISQKKIIDFFPSPQMRLAFTKRFEEDTTYLAIPGQENAWREQFNYEFGFGEITPVYLVDVQLLLSLVRKKFVDQHWLLEERFDIEHLSAEENEIRYKGISAKKIIFCDGIQCEKNPYFNGLPFAPNKGEVLIIESDNIPITHIYKKGINIVPWENNLFWVGSSYEWEFDNDQPTESFRNKTEALLTHWLQSSFKIVDHFASVRPATLERRPFIGFHPARQAVGIMNGMGTKGCSLAPYFAEELVQSIVSGAPISGEANVNRFSKILMRTIS